MRDAEAEEQSPLALGVGEAGAGMAGGALRSASDSHAAPGALAAAGTGSSSIAYRSSARRGFVAKVGDFGLSIKLDPSMPHVSNVFQVRWVPRV
jgi:hypothetical protein